MHLTMVPSLPSYQSCWNPVSSHIRTRRGAWHKRERQWTAWEFFEESLRAVTLVEIQAVQSALNHRHRHYSELSSPMRLLPMHGVTA